MQPKPGRTSRRTVRRDFEALVDQALQSLPAPILTRLENIAVVIEDYPDPADLAEMDMEPDAELYGLYVGVPLTRRSSAYGMVLPDRVVLYRAVLERDFPSAEALHHQIRRTLLHEIGHAVGIDDDRLAELDLD